MEQAKPAVQQSYPQERVSHDPTGSRIEFSIVNPSLALQRSAGRLMTVKQVAELLQVPLSWVYSQTRARNRNRLPGLRLGKYWRFRESEVLAWIETQKS